MTDFDTQLTDCIARANTRPRRAPDGATPADRIGADRAAMTALPPVETAAIGWRHTVRLGRDHYVRLDSCDYSVHPAAVGHRVGVTADLHTVRITRSGLLVGEHERCWARQQTITDPAHRAAAEAMRQAYRDRPRGRASEQVACRDLTDYDRILGTGDELAEVA